MTRHHNQSLTKPCYSKYHVSSHQENAGANREEVGEGGVPGGGAPGGGVRGGGVRGGGVPGGGAPGGGAPCGGSAVRSCMD